MRMQSAMHRLRNLAGRVNTRLRAPVPFELGYRPRVLVAGIYLADKPNTAAHLVRAYASSSACDVEQKWIGLNGVHRDSAVRRVTYRRIAGRAPKFRLLNQLLESVRLADYDYVILSDDDVRVRKCFLDSLISCQEQFDFAIAQPARTWNSYNEHSIVRRDPRYRARQTWFVEIGPVVALQRRTFEHILPFDEQSPMGYGYDFVWPCVLRDAGMTMGVIDCCPVDHSSRLSYQSYSAERELGLMKQYLAERPHLSYAQARQTVRCFS
jgi:hypothetical protein